MLYIERTFDEPHTVSDIDCVREALERDLWAQWVIRGISKDIGLLPLMCKHL